MVYPAFTAVTADPVLLIITNSIIVDLLAELTELVVGVVAVADFAEGAVLARFDFGFYALVDFPVITSHIEAFLISSRLLGRLFAGVLFVVGLFLVTLYRLAIVSGQLRRVVLFGLAVFACGLLDLLVLLVGCSPNFSLLPEI